MEAFRWVLLGFGLLVQLPLLESFEHACSSPMGLANGQIPNSALSASSYYVNGVGPTQARLNEDVGGGAWCPKEPIAPGIREWIQVSLNGTQLLTGLQTQGRYAKGRGQEYAEQLRIEYWRPGFERWRHYVRFDGGKILPGNSDTTSTQTNLLRPPLLASEVRIFPHSEHRRTVCLRLELLGCNWPDGLVSYSVRQGDSTAEGISLRDESYDNNNNHQVVALVDGVDELDNIDSRPSSDEDGFVEVQKEKTDGKDKVDKVEIEKPELLVSGLGQLTDRIYGLPSFSLDIGYGLGNGWVGWRRRKNEAYVEIRVEFEEVRKFNSLVIYTNQSPAKGVQAFAKANVWFSIGGVHFHGRNGATVPNPKETGNVTIGLESSIGRFVRLHLYFRSDWILIGEMVFESETFDGNYTEELGGGDVQMDFPDTQSSLEIRDLDSSTMETLVGVLCGLFLLLLLVTGVVWARVRYPAIAMLHCERVVEQVVLPCKGSDSGSERIHIRTNPMEGAAAVKETATVTCWNLSSPMTFAEGVRVPQVSLRQLRLLQSLGSCLFGQVQLYDLEADAGDHSRLIAKTVRTLDEIHLLQSLDHENVLELIGVCTDFSLMALYAQPECGDLCSFLSRLGSTPSLSWLLNVGCQIASGMAYLESLSIVHRDLAARNCLVEREGSIRISDLAMACEEYRSDYCSMLPWRWWPPESILQDSFNMKSSVWSFGVTLWEVLTLCRERPLGDIPDREIRDIAVNYSPGQEWLPQPLLSPPSIHNLMRECWVADPELRPTFRNIHVFLQQSDSIIVHHVV